MSSFLKILFCHTEGSASGITLLTTLPEGSTIDVIFDIPFGMETETFAILYWDETANSGLGGWVEIDSTVDLVDGTVFANVNYTGTFVLVTQ